MARKKMEPITGMGRDPSNQLTVQKSRPLYALWRSGLTLAEFKILDTYLSRIDSHKPEKRLVRFEKGELEELLGVKKINLPELKERMTHLMGNVVEVADQTAKRGFRLVTLFETAECEQDENGTWQVNLECTQKAMKYFFNIESLGYLRYKLRCVTALTSRYSYIMFLYLEANRFRKSWTEELGELKQILNCDSEETYKEYKKFNQKILNRCHKELNEKTECHYSYEPIKKGRSVVAIRFTVETLPKLEPPDDPNQYTLDDYLPGTLTPEEELLSFLSGACSLPPAAGETEGKCEFTPEEMKQILEVLVTIPDWKLPEGADGSQAHIEFRRYHYLKEKYAALNRANSRNPIRNRFAYFLKMIKQDALPED